MIWAIVTTVLIVVAGSTFMLLYEAALAWIPIISVVGIGSCALLVFFYVQTLLILNKFRDYEPDKAFLEKMRDYYACLEENRLLIKNRKHVKQVYKDNYIELAAVNPGEQNDDNQNGNHQNGGTPGQETPGQNESEDHRSQSEKSDSSKKSDKSESEKHETDEKNSGDRLKED